MMATWHAAIWIWEEEVLGRCQHRGAYCYGNCSHWPTARAGLQSCSGVGRSVGAQLAPCALRHVFMGLSWGKKTHLSLPKPFAVFGQLLEMFGAVSLPPEPVWWWGGCLTWELLTLPLLSRQCVALGQTNLSLISSEDLTLFPYCIIFTVTW